MSRYVDIARGLQGRSYEVGRWDCWGTVAAFYDQAFDIQLPNFARPLYFWDDGLDLINEGYQRAGFEVTDVPLARLAVGDVLVMAVGHRVANHCAVYVGQGQILHHLCERLSILEPLKVGWKTRTLWVGRRPDAYAIPVAETRDKDHNKYLTDILNDSCERAVRFRAERLNLARG